MKNIVYFLHLNIARSKTLSEFYLNLLSKIIKPFPDTKIKQQILNSINSVNWQNLDLQPQNIIVGEKIQFKIIPHIQEFDCQSLLVKKVQYEVEVFDYLDKHIDKFDSVIEIGANVGIFTIYFYKSFLKHNKNIKIFAFEPSQKAYLRLLKNLEINKASGVQTYNSAIGNKVGFLDFFEPEGHLTNGSLNKEFADLFSEQVNQNKALVISASYLSELVNEDDKVLVKIDVEGSEFDVLSSLKDFILNQKPTLIIEVLHTYQQHLNELKFLQDNYNLYNLTSDGLIEHSQFEATSFRDYLLKPK
ncbi:MAG: FkbM family methyltransferase [Gomphosphaeria aponina SAG 52.96 = DSM 107014]|uniref:FkbM family methyltransferase n=1 Tax=Gomphosphaeria aponina SAG 52.96 = DSM 107014 TaxID=1521640 RepID=A0A941JNN6_9CHRO|nr:FkbM family methyltransferase [Gomphosphaeria aponina SAG 52.96 = DSM 107014]